MLNIPEIPKSKPLTFSYTSCEYHINDENLFIYLFGRDEELNKHSFVITDYKVYLFVPEDEEIVDMYETESEYKTLFGQDVKKITFLTPSDYYDFKRDYKGIHFQGDIRFSQMFLIDTGIRKGFDIPEMTKEISWKNIKGF